MTTPTDTVRAALEHYRREANYQRYLAARDFEMPPNVDLMADIDAALQWLDTIEAQVAERGEWTLVPDGEILNSNGLYIEAAGGGWLLRFDKNGPSIWFPDIVRLCRHLAGADEAQP
jgi:hypothetical protein